ncbi:Small-conductance mechanosensitive channel [Alienimonas californiensis]|uniref:Small-conductance mechanosensitive channel n=1 Tax=Alienimonas californiensis TaxID=2527989 RepID=A0A517P5J6_9PLAN|nr:Small-conductance mechanosensitive channel [Alienimonas californiensis]
MALLSVTAPALAPASAPAAFAQDAPPATTDPVEPTEGPDERLSGQTIDVDDETDDEAIAAALEVRLRRLEDAGWIVNPSVRVGDGIVTLRGVSDTPEHRARIAELASTVGGVSVVINNLTVAPPDPFDLSRITATLRGWLTNAVAAVPYVLFALVVLGLTFFAAGLARRLARRVLGPRIENPLLETVAVRAVAILVGIVGVYLVLSVSGLTGLAAGVLGGAGLGGLVVGFAFRNIAENFLASVLLSVSQPFRAGDVVEIGAEKGVVQKVTTRGTWLMSFEGNHIQIPNGTVYTSVIRNLTANPNMRLNFVVGLDYADGVAEAQQVIADALRSHPAVLTDPEPMVLLDELGASTVNLKVYFWCDGVANSTLKVRSSVIRTVKRAVEDAGLTMPDEAREVIFPKGVPLRGLPPAWTHDGRGEDGRSDEGAHGPAAASPPEQAGPTQADPNKADDAPAVRILTPEEPIVSAGEGNLSSDTPELNDQARRSRDPDDARDLLADSPDAPRSSPDRASPDRPAAPPPPSPR